MPTYIPDKMTEIITETPVAIDETAPSFIDTIKSEQTDSKSAIEPSEIDSLDIEKSKIVEETGKVPEKDEDLDKKSGDVPESETSREDMPAVDKKEIPEDVEEIDIHEEFIEGPEEEVVIKTTFDEKERRIPILDRVKSEDQQYFIEYPAETEVIEGEEIITKEEETVVLPEEVTEETTPIKTDTETTLKETVDSEIRPHKPTDEDKEENIYKETFEIEKIPDTTVVDVDISLGPTEVDMVEQNVYQETLEIEKIPQTSSVVFDIEVTPSKIVTCVDEVVDDRTKIDVKESNEEPMTIKETETMVTKELTDARPMPVQQRIDIDIELPEAKKQVRVSTTETIETRKVTTETEVLEDVDFDVSERESRREKLTTFDKIEDDETDKVSVGTTSVPVEDNQPLYTFEITDKTVTVTDTTITETVAETTPDLNEEIDVVERETMKEEMTEVGKGEKPLDKDVLPIFISEVEVIAPEDQLDNIEHVPAEIVKEEEVTERRVSISSRVITSEQLEEIIEKPSSEKGPMWTPDASVESSTEEIAPIETKPDERSISPIGKTDIPEQDSETFEISIEVQGVPDDSSDKFAVSEINLDGQEVDVETHFIETIEIVDAKPEKVEPETQTTFIETIEIDNEKPDESFEVVVKPDTDIVSHFSETITIEDEEKQPDIPEEVILDIKQVPMIKTAYDLQVTEHVDDHIESVDRRAATDMEMVLRPTEIKDTVEEAITSKIPNEESVLFPDVVEIELERPTELLSERPDLKETEIVLRPVGVPDSTEKDVEKVIVEEVEHRVPLEVESVETDTSVTLMEEDVAQRMPVSSETETKRETIEEIQVEIKDVPHETDIKDAFERIETAVSTVEEVPAVDKPEAEVLKHSDVPTETPSEKVVSRPIEITTEIERTIEETVTITTTLEAEETIPDHIDISEGKPDEKEFTETEVVLKPDEMKTKEDSETVPVETATDNVLEAVYVTTEETVKTVFTEEVYIEVTSDVKIDTEVSDEVIISVEKPEEQDVTDVEVGYRPLEITDTTDDLVDIVTEEKEFVQPVSVVETELSDMPVIPTDITTTEDIPDKSEQTKDALPETLPDIVEKIEIRTDIDKPQEVSVVGLEPQEADEVITGI